PPPPPADTPTHYRDTPKAENDPPRFRPPTFGPGVQFEFATSPDVISPPSDGDSPLINVMSVTPVYPQRLLARGIEGYVDLRFDINQDGTPVNVAVTQSSHTGFERAAIAALSRFRYRGGTHGESGFTGSGLEKRFTFEIDRNRAK
ncbi:MAG: TonB family protein, partial [Pseudomonadota bacterium]